jgi:hypothetical protein
MVEDVDVVDDDRCGRFGLDTECVGEGQTRRRSCRRPTTMRTRMNSWRRGGRLRQRKVRIVERLIPCKN